MPPFLVCPSAGSFEGDADGKDAAAGGSIVGEKLPVISFHDIFTDGQSQSGTFPGCFGRKKGFKEFLTYFFGQTDAGIGEFDE